MLVGTGDKLGFLEARAQRIAKRSYLGTTLEGTAATIAASGTAVESNTVDLNSALDANPVTVLMEDMAE